MNKIKNQLLDWNVRRVIALRKNALSHVGLWRMLAPSISVKHNV